MPQIINNMDAVRRLLLKPKDNQPNQDTILGAILDETVHLENELGNASTGLNLTTIKVNSFNTSGDITISNEDVGKILLVTWEGGGRGVYGNSYGYGQGQSLEFTDLGDTSGDWWSYMPIVSDRLRDKLNGNGYGGSKIAFYRENGVLKARMPDSCAGASLSVKAAKAFSRKASLSSRASLPAYHNLINVRAAMNVLPGAEWSGDFNRDEATRRNLMQTLPRQEARYYEQFIIAKRSPNGSDVVFINADEDY